MILVILQPQIIVLIVKWLALKLPNVICTNHDANSVSFLHVTKSLFIRSNRFQEAIKVKNETMLQRKYKEDQISYARLSSWKPILMLSWASHELYESNNAP